MLIVVVLAVFAVLLLYPIGLTVRGGFAADVATGSGWTLEHLALVFKDPSTLEGLWNALGIAIATTLLSCVIALPLAVLSANHTFPFKKALEAAILVPLILPPFVGAIGVRAILGREGALNALLGTDFDPLGQARFWGVVLVEALHLYPIIYLNATAALANIDPAMTEAAENLGSGPWRRFLRITLPLIRPGLFAGGTIVFIWSFTELGTPLIFDYYQVTPVQIFNGLKEVEGSARPYALTVVLLGVSILLYALGRFAFGRRGHAMTTRASRAGGLSPLAGWKGWIGTAGFCAVTFLAIVPHLGVILTSLAEPASWYRSVLPTEWTASHFQQALGSPEAFRAITNSLGLALAAMILDIGAGVLIGYLIVRTTARGRALLDALCMLPLAVPGLVLAFGYIAVTLRWPFGDGGPLDGTIFDLAVLGQTPNPFPILIIAYAVRRLPYIVRSSVAGLEQTSGELEEAAINLGASRLHAVRRVIVPLIAANLVAGGLLVFAFSMLEVSDSLLLAQRAVHFPITKMIYDFTLRLGDGPYIASAMGVWGMALLTVTLLTASALLGKKMGAIFRV
ncbi:MAG: iron ABC transporter permease [Phycisphaeraceae bacterium]|nr:MAG: iron ABC transporter permease [Phycisphaeraceae bacterium]